MVFKTTAGSTTAENNARNGAGKLTIINADPRNTTPLTNVPMTETIPALTIGCATFCKASTSPKHTKAVTSLSIMFGINPPGNVEMIPDKIPAKRPVNKTCFFSGKSKMAINIITRSTSGLIPAKVTAKISDKTVPIPNSKAINTRFLVFILNSPLLS